MGPRRSRPRQLFAEASSPRRTAYAGPGESAPEDPFAVVRLRFRIPSSVYLSPFSRAHPEMLIVITATQVLPGYRVLAELDLLEPSPTDHTDEIRSEPGVLSVSRIGPVGPRTRYQAIAKEPSYLVLADELEVLCRYPRFAQDGEHTFEVASRVSQLRKLIQGLQELSPKVTVESFGRDPMRTCPPTLTSRQQALLHQALAAGYFDVPRQITLTQFARRVGRSKSATSRALALIEKELAEASIVPGA